MTILSRLRIVERHLPGGDITTAYDVQLDAKTVGSRLHRPTIAEAEAIARAASAPPLLVPVFDRNTNTHRRFGRPSNAEKAAREKYQEDE